MFAALKMREREKGGEREKETVLKLKKTFQSLWTPCRTCSQQVAYSQIDDLQVVQRTSSLPFLEGTKHIQASW